MISRTQRMTVTCARSIQARQASSVKSIGTGEDVAGLVSYLASENSRYVSGEWCHVRFYSCVLRKMIGDVGETITIDGGTTLI